MKSVSLAMTLDSTTSEHLFETALGIPGVLAVLVDRRAGAVKILAMTTQAAETARASLRAWTFT